MTIDELRTEIIALIRANGVQAITGDVMQRVLLDIVGSLTPDESVTTIKIVDGAVTLPKLTQDIRSRLLSGFSYMGKATPATSPNTSIGRMFYITTTPGTFTFFGGITVSYNGITALMYDGNTWTADTLMTVDTAPVSGSTNPITSGAMATALGTKADKADTYTKAEVDNLIIPVGTDVVVVESSDWPVLNPQPNTIYRVAGVSSYSDYAWDGAQFVKLAESTFGVDAVPTLGSTNLIESNGVAEKTNIYDTLIDGSQTVNLFDKNAATDGHYVRRTDGTLTGGGGGASYFATDFIPIDSRGLYAALANGGGTYRGYAVYDASKQYTHGGSTQTVTFQSGDAYVRLTGLMTDKDAFMVVAGTSSDYPSEYVPFGFYGFFKPNVVDDSAIADDAVTTRAIADDAVTMDKISFTALQGNSTNLLDTNDPDFSDVVGDFINYNTGAAAHTSQSTVPHGRTPFIPVSKSGLFFNAFVTGGIYGGAVYDANKQYLRKNNSSKYVYQEGDAFVRWTLAADPIAPYSAGQFMVFEGDGTELPPYDEYDAKKVISEDVLPSMSVQIADGSIGLYKLNNDAQARISGDGVEICMPDVIPVVVGDVLRIYYRAIVKSPNPSIWDITAVSNVGKNYPKHYLFTPSVPGNNIVTFYVRNASRRIIAQKTVTIKAIAAIDSPATNQNILMLGGSMLADGNIAFELNRRLTSNTGDGTPLNPTGLNLGNITFVGRLTGSAHPEMRQEATGGWSWKDYATEGRLAVRFFVSGVDLLHIGDIYTDSTNSYTFTIAEINVTGGVGNIRCTVSTNVSIAASGTLTRIDGTGDAIITYSSWQQESRNPFWNNVTEQLDFTSYANDWCNGNIDVLLSFAAMNDFTSHTESELPAVLDDYVKPFARAFHDAFPQGVFILCTMYLGSPNGGMAASYGASNTWNYYVAARKVWRWSELIREMAADDEFSPYVKVIDTNSSFDCENLYPTGQFTVANRLTTTETLQTNGVHTSAAGKQTIADSMFNGINDIL